MLLLLLAVVAGRARAGDELVTSAHYPGGESIAYIQTSGGGRPSHAVLLMPGGAGNLAPRIEDGRLVYSLGGNFLIRSRELFGRPPFVAVSMDATTTPGRVMAIVADLQGRFGPLAVYVIGTSRGTYASMTLAERLDGQVAGFIHTSSLNSVASFDTRPFKSRNLIVHHRMDSCSGTRFADAESSHKFYGTALIAIDGGVSVGRPCEAWAHHGFNGVEPETVGKIRTWILDGR
jgi:hypothetical protein